MTRFEFLVVTQYCIAVAETRRNSDVWRFTLECSTTNLWKFTIRFQLGLMGAWSWNRSILIVQVHAHWQRTAHTPSSPKATNISSATHVREWFNKPANSWMFYGKTGSPKLWRGVTNSVNLFVHVLAWLNEMPVIVNCQQNTWTRAKRLLSTSFHRYNLFSQTTDRKQARSLSLAAHQDTYHRDFDQNPQYSGSLWTMHFGFIGEAENHSRLFNFDPQTSRRVINKPHWAMLVHQTTSSSSAEKYLHVNLFEDDSRWFPGGSFAILWKSGRLRNVHFF